MSDSPWPSTKGAAQLIGNRFRIADLDTDLLGRGGMGAVYRATDTHTGEVVAVKALDPAVVTGTARLGGGMRLTQTGALMGTVAYLSPEACRGEPVDERSDIWSFGVLLFELLTGRVPFGGSTMRAAGRDAARYASPDGGALQRGAEPFGRSGAPPTGPRAPAGDRPVLRGSGGG